VTHLLHTAGIGRTSPENWTELARRHDTWIVDSPIMSAAAIAIVARECLNPKRAYSKQLLGERRVRL
jgi:hypothetical protein